MAKAAAPLGAARSRSVLRKPSAPRWVVVAVVCLYCASLAAGLAMYRRLDAAAVHVKAAGTPESHQIGRIFVVTPNGCRSGEFDNARPTFALSQTPCDEARESIEPGADANISGDARIKAIGQYFRGAN